MNTAEVSVLRIYVTEGEAKLQELLKFLRDEEPVRGVTVFRGIAGFGPSGELHTSSLTDLSLDLPLVIELFDESGKVQRIMKSLSSIIKPGHMLTWPAKINIDGTQ